MSRSVTASVRHAFRMCRRSDATPRFGAVLVVVALLVAASPVRTVAQTATDPVVQRAISAYEAGELVRALALLDSVPSSLPAREGAIRRLYRGLIEFAFGDTDAAQQEFSMAVRLDPELRLNPAVHSPSRIEAFSAAQSAVVAEWREDAAEAEASGELALASRRWHSVLLALPGDTEAQARIMAVNQALSPGSSTSARPVREVVTDSSRAQRAAAADTGAAVADTGSAVADPGAGAAPDTVATPAGSAGTAALPTYSPAQAAVMGVIFPGLGEVYVDRPVHGGLIMAAAAGALTAGVLVERVVVRCLSVPVNNFCPIEDLAGEEVERPYLIPAIGAAGVLAVIGAIDAYASARRANERAADAASGRAVGFAPRLEAPTVAATPYDIRITFFRVRF